MKKTDEASLLGNFSRASESGLEAGISAGKAEEFIENIKNTVEKKLGKYF